MNDLELQLPEKRHKTAAEEFRKFFLEHGETVIYGSAMFDQMEFDEWLKYTTENRENGGSNGWVPATTFFVIRKSDAKIIGMLDVRHHLQHQFLAKYGGHIGYSVVPGERKKGYATEILKLGKQFAETLKIPQLMVCCFSDNLGSIKTIEKNGGVLSETLAYEDENFTKIPGTVEKKSIFTGLNSKSMKKTDK